jgi:hypothetical protein
MAHKTKLLPEKEWMSIAKKLSEQPCTTKELRNLPTLENNRCASCHGPHGLSSNTKTPNLAGQNISYMIAQIQKFREPFNLVIGDNAPITSTHRLHPLMSLQASRVIQADLVILQYYAALPCRQLNTN